MNHRWPRLLHSPNLLVLWLAVGYDLQCIMYVCDRWEFIYILYIYFKGSLMCSINCIACHWCWEFIYILYIYFKGSLMCSINCIACHWCCARILWTSLQVLSVSVWWSLCMRGDSFLEVVACTHTWPSSNNIRGQKGPPCGMPLFGSLQQLRLSIQTCVPRNKDDLGGISKTLMNS